MGATGMDPRRYARLLTRTLPRVIHSEREYGRLLAEAETLMDKGDGRTAEEDALLELVVSLIEDYEAKQHALPDASPREMLIHLMEKRGLKRADLLGIFKSRGYVSDVINGKRAISKRHARELAEFLGVSAELFI